MTFEGRFSKCFFTSAVRGGDYCASSPVNFLHVSVHTALILIPLIFFSGRSFIQNIAQLFTVLEFAATKQKYLVLFYNILSPQIQHAVRCRKSAGVGWSAGTRWN